ncbi:MAG TPA: adenosylmethionine--8-amino-7-oxononanoate transaminase, partial [Candidatus Dormibacteraeota bacterium]|nr:adenosylmethionine--8-amino-7-oxononanoate transaminase [Candidatus Dormibacteraeota bacterium]
MAATRRSTDDLFRADVAHVWHPFTQMADYAATEPLIVDSAEGNWLVDTEGRRYLDGVSSLWCNVHGHRVPEIDDAIRAQLGRVAHSTLLGSGSVPSIELAAKLAEIAPAGLTRVFYAENGASAVEIALKMAFQHWRHRGQPGRTRFLAFANAYHGDTLGAVSVGGIELFHEAFRPLLFDVLRAPSPYHYRCPDGHAGHEECGRHSLAVADRLLAEHAGEVGAVILEPLVQGAAGMITQPPGFLAGLAEVCRRHDVLLILDEVATGFGRTGTLFACEQEGVAPDLLVLGKGITGGYLPMSAVLAGDAFAEPFLGAPTAGRTFYHGHTYTGNQLCCAAALANLDLFDTRDVVARGREAATLLASQLERFEELPAVGQVRQRGLMVGIELVADRETRAVPDPRRRLAWNVCLGLRRRGVLIRPLGDVVVLMPPLSIRPEE